MIFVSHPRPAPSARHAVTARHLRQDGRRGEVPRLDQDLPASSGCTHRARERWPQLASVEVRHRANFSYIDGVLTDGTTLKLCRLRYGGSAHHWGFAIYRASHDDYEDSFLPTGLPVGTCEDALDTACGLYLGDPTAWT